MRETSEERERLEQLAALGRASAGHAHELKNGLMVLQGFAQLARGLAEKSPQDPRLVTYVREVEAQANRMIADLRSYLALARGDDEEELEERPLGEVVDEVVRLVKPLARQRELQFELARETEATRPVRDPPMRRALLNLLLNALDFAGTRVSLALREESGALVVEVADDGPGLPPSLQDELFAPFVTGRPSGTGLGLSQVKRAVEAEGGTVRAFANAEGGARFVVHLPTQRG